VSTTLVVAGFVAPAVLAGADLRDVRTTRMIADGPGGQGLYGALTDDGESIPKWWALRRVCRREP
jgi:hypothetical protein